MDIIRSTVRGSNLDYISVQYASKKCDIFERHIQKLREENRITGVVRFGRMWLMPKGAEKLVDGRLKINKEQDGDE